MSLAGWSPRIVARWPSSSIGPVSDDRLYFRQLLSGRDFAVGDPVAVQMVNFVYLIGDRETGEALVVDPAYRVDDLLAVAEADGMDVVGALVTHHHPDHVGGSFMGIEVEGVAELLGRRSIPVHANDAEVASIVAATGASTGDIVGHAGGDKVEVGALSVQLVHTPGHTPGSQCFLVGPMLVSGDTLFLEGCGRTDLPGSNSEDMYHSLRRLAELPDGTAVFPGHRYSVPSSATMEAVREMNTVFRPTSEAQWLAMFGG
jgi:glyoxylase-like metal-dependent hydrolase (beta-lactamase superfamily II)